PSPRSTNRARPAAARVRGELRRGPRHLERDPLRAGRTHRPLPRLLLADAVLPEGQGVLGPRVARPLGVPPGAVARAGRPALAAPLGDGIHLVRVLVHRRELLVSPALAGRGG